MNTKVIEYSNEYEGQLEKLFADFQDYLINLDPLKRLRRMPGYEKEALQETIKESEANHGIFYLALDNEKVIGFCVGIIEKVSGFELLNTIPSTMGRVTELYVNKKYRGSGLGRLLMNHLEQYFKDQNCDCIKIEVFKPNINAHLFYTKLGYEDRNVEVIKRI